MHIVKENISWGSFVFKCRHCGKINGNLAESGLTRTDFFVSLLLETHEKELALNRCSKSILN